MGASISCALFESFSTALHWFVQDKSNNQNILHYLDDFLFGGVQGSLQCSSTLSIFIDSCKEWGVPLAEEKTVEPTEILVFLGVEFDTIEMVMRLPQDKVSELRDQINLMLSKETTTLNDLQSIIGMLAFACRVIAPGRAFCRRLIDATCGLTHPKHHTRVTKSMKEDLNVWLSFLKNYNGSTVMLDYFWTSSLDLELYSDSAGGSGLGFGIYFMGRWAQETWPKNWESLNIMSDITFLELFPVVVALSIWKDELKNKRILFHIDNASVVTIINKKSCKSERVMALVRKLVLVCLELNILLKAEHIQGVQNTIVDSLSRCNFQKFRHVCPDADPQPAAIPPHLWKI